MSLFVFTKVETQNTLDMNNNKCFLMNNILIYIITLKIFKFFEILS